VTLEAMACGLPVIVTDSFGPDLITDGLEGNIVPVENPQALAEAIRRLANNRGLGRTQGSVGRRTVEERFSMDRVVQRYMSLYDDVLESSAPAARLQVPAIAGRGKRP
jgi:glycosyltransferase involved in cell wall biosynthesis